ncbi:MAG TPA: DUF2797 domain-containing protein [Gammaproteobacteria bacterium]|nr:DUF2797 domain-containing protein [Gammaproteobacteria bacterium]
MSTQVGIISKLTAEHTTPINYFLHLGADPISLNGLLGKKLRLRFTGKIHCNHCARPIKKTYRGYCFPCSQKLASCDLCIVKPELCHFHLGTCRDPRWASQHCMIPHYIYLANTSELKVGITRKNHIPNRWLEQGATSALPIIEVKTRQQSGFVEEIFKQFVKDKTNWRQLLRCENENVDLRALASILLEKADTGLQKVLEYYGKENITLLKDPFLFQFSYPVIQYPRKLKSLALDKEKEISDTLLGLKGQYFIFDEGVLNIRKHTGFEIEFEAIN